MKDVRRRRPSWTRRSFLQTVGATAPTLSLVLDRSASAGQASAPAPSEKSSLFEELPKQSILLLKPTVALILDREIAS